MPTTPLKADVLEDGREIGARPRDWQPRRSDCKVPFRLLRLCLLGAFLPSALVAGPMYLRYRVYSEQLYPLAASDQRLIDARVSTTWCQSQVVRANATFNAYLLSDAPKVQSKVQDVSMTRHLILEDDMKEYWGFYLLRGSSVTVSTCVRWPGASLTIIRGHKHLHECAFIGDDSSEELQELAEEAEERGSVLTANETVGESLINEPDKMKRAGAGVRFHRQGDGSNDGHGKNHSGSKHNNASPERVPPLTSNRQDNSASSHELDSKAMRTILSHLFVKTLDTKRKQQENPHHHYEATYVESANIDKPVRATEEPCLIDDDSSEKTTKTATTTKPRSLATTPTTTTSTTTTTTTTTECPPKTEESDSSERDDDDKQEDSIEVFQDVLRRMSSLGSDGRKMLRRLIDEIDAHGAGNGTEAKTVRRILEKDKLRERRARRDLFLSSPLGKDLTGEDEDGDAAIEEGVLHPDGIAEDRGTVDERTLNDKSNSEFWSSFSSSEERLLECKGLILNLPLTPHRHCTPRHEALHSQASFANTVTYRVPTDAYYFFVFNSENEIQPNYLRVRFDLMKTVYNTSNSVHECTNSTKECSLPFKIFSNERTVLELPLTGNDSQWNEEYVVVSTCEPRTSVYLICVILVPLLILVFAFH